MEQIDMTAMIVLGEYNEQMARSFKHIRPKTLSSGDSELDSAVYTIARTCLEHKIDPRHYVAICIDILREPLPGEGKTKRLITPKSLCAENMMTKYLTRLKTANGGDPAYRWDIQVSQLKRIMLLNPQYTTESEALVMFSFPFEDWFRIMYVKPVHERIFQVYGASAWDDLRDDRFLREYLRTIAPENMRELEKRIARFVDSV